MRLQYQRPRIWTLQLGESASVAATALPFARDLSGNSHCLHMSIDIEACSAHTLIGTCMNGGERWKRN